MIFELDVLGLSGFLFSKMKINEYMFVYISVGLIFIGIFSPFADVIGK